MSVDRLKLEQTLTDLHEQLTELDQIDPQMRERLRIALAEIQVALAAGSQRSAGDQSAAASVPASGRPVSTRLREAAEHFEGSHPRLSATLGSLVEAVSRMGI